MTTDQLKIDLVSQILAFDSAEALIRLADVVNDLSSSTSQAESHPSPNMPEGKPELDPAPGYRKILTSGTRPAFDFRKYSAGRKMENFDFEALRRRRPVKPHNPDDWNERVDQYEWTDEFMDEMLRTLKR